MSIKYKPIYNMDRLFFLTKVSQRREIAHKGAKAQSGNFHLCAPDIVAKTITSYFQKGKHLTMGNRVLAPEVPAYRQIEPYPEATCSILRLF